MKENLFFRRGRKRRRIFGEEKCGFRGEGKGGKYLEKENIIFFGGEENRRRKMLAKENFTITGETNNQTRKDRATQPMDHGRLR